MKGSSEGGEGGCQVLVPIRGAGTPSVAVTLVEYFSLVLLESSTR